MAQNGPPPPPAPPPPPLPKKGGKSAPDKESSASTKKLVDLKAAERMAWVNDKDGLGLTQLKVAYFPDDDALLSQIGTANTNKGKLLPDENTIQNKVKTTLQQAVKAQFTELFKLAEQDPQRAQSLLKRID
ncbi:MAG: hypothetical protein AB7I18_04330, partial [Candidatus Berkiella sp.]